MHHVIVMNCNSYLRIIDRLLHFWQAAIELGNLSDAFCQLVLLCSDMRPRELLLQFIGFVALLSRFGSLFKAHSGLFECSFEVRDGLTLLPQDLRSLIDILEAGVVFVAKLT